MKRLVGALLIAGAVLLTLPLAEQVFAAPGDGPVNAVTLDCGTPVTVAPGSSYWLKINNTPGWQVHLTLAQPAGGGLSFEVYAPDQAALFGTDQKMNPMGRGTPLGGTPGGDLNWEGHLPQGGVIYILVKNTSQSPVQLNFRSCAYGNQFEMVYIPPEPCPTGLFRNVYGVCAAPRDCPPPLVPDGNNGCKAVPVSCAAPLVSDGVGGCTRPDPPLCASPASNALGLFGVFRPVNVQSSLNPRIAYYPFWQHRSVNHAVLWQAQASPMGLNDVGNGDECRLEPQWNDATGWSCVPVGECSPPE